MKSQLPLLSTLLMFAVSAGCHSDADPVPVSGQVKLNGKPLPGAAVTFVPIDGGSPAVGITDDSGRFSLRCDGRDGALPGHYNVAVNLVQPLAVLDSPDGLSPPRAPEQPANQSVKQTLPARYGNPINSGFTVEVKPKMEPVQLELTDE